MENFDSNREKPEQKIAINTSFIKLDSFVKFCGEASIGSEAKEIILNGKVKVNGEICRQRGKKLFDGDTVEVLNKIYKVSKSCKF